MAYRNPLEASRRPTRDHEFRVGQDVAMISNPTTMGHVVGFDPDGSVMVQWSGGRAVSGVDPRNLRAIGRGYAGRRASEARPPHAREARRGREEYVEEEYVETVDGEWMILVNGFQWGLPGAKIDRSGAADTTFATKAEAQRAYREHRLKEPATRSPPRGGATRRISHRAPQMTHESVMQIAGDLSRKVGAFPPDYIQGGFRWSDRNEAAKFTTYSPEHNQKVVVVVSVFEDGTIAQDFFSDEYLSETNRYENIAHFLYSMVDFGEMAADLKWVWETVDGYAASWKEGNGGGGMDESRAPKDAWSEDMRAGLGTVGHNRHFSVRDLVEYLHGRVESNTVRHQLQKLVRAEYVGHDKDGYYITSLGWNWIEGAEQPPRVDDASRSNPNKRRKHGSTPTTPVEPQENSRR